jgi:tetratricopeptide (TPR) repeat protein
MTSPISSAFREQRDQQLQQVLPQIDLAEAQADWPSFERLCKQCLQIDPDQWSIWERLARSHETRGALEEAETLWRHLTRRFSQRPEPFVALAALQRRRGAPEAARIVLEQARQQLGPSRALDASLQVVDDPWAEDPAAVPPLTGDASAAQVAALFERARDHLLHGRLPEAEAALQQLVVARPTSVPFHRQLAELRWRRGDALAVIQQLLPSYQPLPDTAAAFADLTLPVLLLRALLDQQRFADATPILEALREHHPSHLEVMLLSAEHSTGLGLDLEALRWLERAVPAHGLNHSLQRRLGEIKARLGDWQGAIEHYTHAVAADPRDNVCREALQRVQCEQLWWQAETALEQGQWRQAEGLFRQLLALEPQADRSRQRLALLQSLSPEAISVAQPAPLNRLQQFAACLDRLEAALADQL